MPTPVVGAEWERPWELGLWMSSPIRCNSPEEEEWDRRVAREGARQAHIEAAFDRADEFDRLGDAELALEWLDKAGVLSGGLTPSYREKRLRLRREARGPVTPAPDEPAPTLAFSLNGGPEANSEAREAPAGWARAAAKAARRVGREATASGEAAADPGSTDRAAS